MGLNEDLIKIWETAYKEWIIMCEKCENYKPPKVEQAKMDCYKNKCAECKCKACADFSDCDNKKCYTCKFQKTYSVTSGVTGMITGGGYYNVL
jgi:hypothetical protein